MYSSRQLVKGLANPQRGLLALNTIYNRRIRGREGVSIMDRDWDNILILDACRFDLFSECNNFSGVLKSVISRGSHTNEFLEENFDSDEFLNTIYVSASPQLTKIDARFRDIRLLCIDQWDEVLRTVHPETVRDVALEMDEKHPNKRLIVHFIQPHIPFIGETGKKINQPPLPHQPNPNRKMKTVFDRLKEGELDQETVWRAYRENLELVLPFVEDLISDLTGRTVVTSDHGNAFGEWGVYGHPSGIYLDCLVRVPWLVVDAEERKKIVESDRGQQPTSVEDVTKERLAHLGYVD